MNFFITLALSLLVLTTTNFAKTVMSVEPVSYPLRDDSNIQFKEYSSITKDITTNGIYLIRYYIGNDTDVQTITAPTLFIGPTSYPIRINFNKMAMYRFGSLDNSNAIENFKATAILLPPTIQKNDFIDIYFYYDGRGINFPQFYVRPYDEAVKNANRQTLFNSTIIQAIAFVALFAFIFFFGYSLALRKYDSKDILFFSLFALSIFLGYTHFIVNSALSNSLCWFKVSRIGYIFAPLFLFMFATKYSAIMYSKKMNSILSLLIFILMLTIAKAPSIKSLEQTFSLISLIYIIPTLFITYAILILKLLRDTFLSDLTIILGYSTFLFAVFYDIFHLVNGNEPYFWTTPYGYFTLISTIVFAITTRHSLTHKSLIQYKNSLTISNQQLIEAKDKAVAESRTKEKFIKSIAHEFRTPLNGIRGAIESIISSDMIPQELGGWNEYLNTSLFRLEILIQNLLDYQALKDGNFTLQKSTFSLKKMLEDIIELNRANVKSKDISFIPLVDYDKLPEFIYTDISRLSLVINNILQNAIKFTDNGGVSISAEYGDTLLSITISDTGCGINKQKISKIFNSFKKGEDISFSQKYEGIGLGLAIVDAIVTQMNGNIEVQSKEGQGSTFIITIPIVESINVDSINEKINILIVDDNTINLTITKFQLNRTNFNVTTATNGKEAVELCKKEIFDIIFMDIQMPVLDGIEATKLIKKQYPNLPIIGLTANASKRECLEAGMADIIYKPNTKNMLCDAISKYCKKRDFIN